MAQLTAMMGVQTMLTRPWLSDVAVARRRVTASSPDQESTWVLMLTTMTEMVVAVYNAVQGAHLSCFSPYCFYASDKRKEAENDSI